MDVDSKAKDLLEEAMALYNTIEIETTDCENTYKDALSKIDEILNGEEPLFIESDLGEHLSLLTMIGYNSVGVKYLERLLDNKNISVAVLAELINRVYRLTSLATMSESELPSDDKPIKEKEVKGISIN